MRRIDCSKSPDGKHKWTVSKKNDPVFGETQYRKCDFCKLQQKHEMDAITGRIGWKAI